MMAATCGNPEEHSVGGVGNQGLGPDHRPVADDDEQRKGII